MKNCYRILIGLLVLFSFNIVVIANEKIEVSLVKCVDGDTAVFKLDGEDVKFRFLAIDTPESVHPKKDVEEYGKEASSYTCDLLENAKNIYVEYDSKGSKTDKYGRNLAWIWIGDDLLQSVLIRNGYATVAYIYSKYAYVNDLCATQQKAIDEKLNIWSDDREIGYCSTIDYSKGVVQELKTFNVTFKDSEGKTIKTVSEGHSVKEINASKKEGFSFIGWYMDDVKYDFNNIVDSDIVLEAKYKLDYSYILYGIIVIIISFSLKKINGDKRKKK